MQIIIVYKKHAKKSFKHAELQSQTLKEVGRKLRILYALHTILYVAYVVLSFFSNPNYKLDSPCVFFIRYLSLTIKGCVRLCVCLCVCVCVLSPVSAVTLN